jgi:hypothetical protein
MTTTQARMAHVLRRVAGAALVAALVAGLVAGTALAKGKTGGSSGTSGLAVVMVLDQNGNGAPNWNDHITFKFTTSNSTPQINTTCTQSGSVVYSSSHLMYTPNVFNDDGVFWLSSPAWSGGAASCTAVLKGNASNGSLTTLGSLTFSVGA